MPNVDLVRLVMEVEHRLALNLDDIPDAGPFTLGDLHAIIVRALQDQDLDEREADRQSWATLLAVFHRLGIDLNEVSPQLVLLGERA